MKYIEFPSALIAEVSEDTLNQFHLSPRFSVNREKVIMKLEHYEKLFPSVMTLPEWGEDTPSEPEYPYPVYEGKELDSVLNTPEWVAPDQPIL